MKKILSTLVALTLWGTATSVGKGFVVGDFKYDITSYSDREVSVSVENPYDISGDVVIPDSVSFEGETFTVTSIARYGFEYCMGVRSITIPASINKIEESSHGVFGDCDFLEKIIVAPENTSFTSFQNSLYNKDKTILFKVPARYYDSDSEVYDIPETVTTIGNYAFTDCNWLTSIIIPESVSVLGVGAFEWCSYLESITLPEAITEIPDDIFTGCSDLSSVNIPEGVTSIGKYAFYGCSTLPSLRIPKAVTSIGVNALLVCRKMTEIIVDNDNEVFSSFNKSLYDKDQTVLLQVPGGYEGPAYGDFPESITSIGEDAFWNCDNITSVEIPASVTLIGESAFLGCEKLEAINIPDGVSTIKDRTFSYCESLSSISIPKSVESIGTWAFRDCESLTEVYSYNSNPPVSASNAFFRIPTNAVLYVPRGSKENYAAAEGWSVFMDIREMEGDDISTSVNDIFDNDQMSEERIYDYNGHRLNKPRKGQINIINGRKVLIK